MKSPKILPEVLICTEEQLNKQVCDSAWNPDPNKNGLNWAGGGNAVNEAELCMSH